MDYRVQCGYPHRHSDVMTLCDICDTWQEQHRYERLRMYDNVVMLLRDKGKL